MKRTFLFTIVFFLFQIPCFAQNNNIELIIKERIDADKPTVYLSYSCQDEKKIYLRMYNNTVWYISVNADKSYFPTSKPIKLWNGNKGYAIPSDEEIPIHYYVEKDDLVNIKNIHLPRIKPYYINLGGNIASQDSILFSIPIEHLRKGLKIYVEFSYQWEIVQGGTLENEPQHRVYFRGGDTSSANTDIKPLPCSKLPMN